MNPGLLRRPQTSEEIIIKFLPDSRLHLVLSPAPTTSAGICGSMSGAHQQRTSRASPCFGPPRNSHRIRQVYSHVLPSPRVRTFSDRRVIRRNWALIGDRRRLGLIPPPAKALFYAMRSGELLGKSLGRRAARKISARVKSPPSPRNSNSPRASSPLLPWIVPRLRRHTRMVQFLQPTPYSANFFSDLFCGTQDYTTLKQRVLGPSRRHAQPVRRQRPQFDRPPSKLPTVTPPIIRLSCSGHL